MLLARGLRRTGFWAPFPSRAPGLAIPMQPALARRGPARWPWRGRRRYAQRPRRPAGRTRNRTASAGSLAAASLTRVSAGRPGGAVRRLSYSARWGERRGGVGEEMIISLPTYPFFGRCNRLESGQKPNLFNRLDSDSLVGKGDSLQAIFQRLVRNYRLAATRLWARLKGPNSLRPLREQPITARNACGSRATLHNIPPMWRITI